MSYQLHDMNEGRQVDLGSSYSGQRDAGFGSEAIEVGQQQPARSSGRASFRNLFAFTARNHIGILAVALIASAAIAALKTALAVILGKIFDVVADFGSHAATGTSALREISQWCLVITALGIGQWFSNTVFLGTWVVFGEMQAESVRCRMFSRLLAKEMGWFDSLDQGISSLLVRIQTQTRELQTGTSQVFGHLVCETMTSIASLGIALYYSWKLTMVLLATLPMTMGVLWLASRRIEPAIQGQRGALAIASKHMTASIAAIDLVKIFNGADQDSLRYCGMVKEAARFYLVQAQCSAIQVGYTAFWFIILFVAGFWYGVVLVNDGLRPGVVITTFYATLMAFQGAEALLPHWLVIAKGMSAGFYLSTLAQTQAPRSGNLDDQNSTTKPANCVGAIGLSKVSFTYPSNPLKPALYESSFDFPAGQTTFIVGRSGSGKSTIGGLVGNLYEPTTGKIYLDGLPYDGLDKTWLKSNITLIQQASVLFSGTFSDNVSLGHPNPSRASYSEVKAACKATLLQTTITSLPHGLQTRVGTGGHALSGGQKQRLALARAHIRNPTVLVLDEVTSALDQITRILLMKAIREWRRDKTTIIITHDTSQILDDDFVYVLKDAKLVEEGYKRELLKREYGQFASMISAASRNSTSTIAEALEAPASLPPCFGTRGSEYWLGQVSQLATRFPTTPLLSNGSRLSWSIPAQPPTFGHGEDACALPTSPRRIYQARAPNRMSSLYSEMTMDVEAERRRFSTFLTEQFVLQQETKPSRKTANAKTLSLSTIDGSESWNWSEFSDTATDGFISSRGSQAPTLDKHLSVPASIPCDAERHTTQHGCEQERPKKPASLLAIAKTVWPALKSRERTDLVLGFVACLTSAGSTPAFAFCFAKLLSAFWSPGDKAVAGRDWAIALVGIAVLDGVTTAVCRYLVEKAAQAWVNTLRVKALANILGQPKVWFDQAEHSAGRLNECLDRNSEEMRNLVGRFLPIILHVIAILTISITWALVVSWKLTLVSLSPIPVILCAIKGYSTVSDRWEKECSKSAEEASATLTEIFLNIRVVKSLTLDKHFSNKYLRLVVETFGIGLRRALYPSPLYGVYQSTSYAVVALVFYYGAALMTSDGRISATEMMQVVNLILFAIGMATSILSHIPQMTMAQATAGTILELARMPIPSWTHDPGHHRLCSPLPLRATALSFSYPLNPERRVLERVSFEIVAGDSTAIVGYSGCGKSTIISLLLGLYVPNVKRGAPSPLTYGGVPQSEIDMANLRLMIAYVPQSPFLFPGTIAENITYGLPYNSTLRQDLHIYRAAQESGIHDFIISLPEGYNTVIGEGGQALSGGQAQRVNIARALIRRPKLLVLDEPTSALDAESAEMVRRTLRDLTHRSKGGKADMAIVLITHSIEMMQVADKIVVVQDGRTVEEGVYEELLRAGGPFTELLGTDNSRAKESGM